MTLLRLTVAGVLATGLVIGTASTGTAKQATITDRRADVVQYADADDQTGTILDETASVESGVDITRFRVNHGKKSVGLTVNVADLSADARVVVYFRINGEGTPKRALMHVSASRAEVVNIFGEDSCRVPVETKLGSKGYVRATFKRSCLDNPKKLKASALLLSDRDSAADEPYATDYASSTKYRSTSPTKWLKRG